ncbi:MAG: flagellar motor switch protein FliG [Limnochordia bacterium]|jgi:flagellar motor switch protein FliG|nr:flagellar motor switch protein FliG [Limnochordia bacterium]MDI9465406.1 flagellar motor switch protein FliG [Bacillota bacterium]NLO95175.1 flagellar motor switch protein FliG [Bacillota bacterium]HAN94588.1 flagellar motor switch protein FliG [Bacillota bacterium]HOB41294.1 flagellar motor switch protein FliG [Limnochordia bacterium]
MRAQRLSGKEKAAVLMVSLGPELSASIFKHLKENEIEDLTLAIAGLKRVQPELRDEVMEEFHELIQAREYLEQGGIEYARELLEKALGPERAEDIIKRLTASLAIRPFDFARKTDPGQLLNFIQNEHPQTIALILAYLHPEQAGLILSSLSPELQVDVARRVAKLDRTNPEVLQEIESTLEQRLSAFVMDDYTVAGGIESIVDILNMVDRTTEKTILDSLEEEEPELAEEIRKRMFVFEDIILLDDRSIQKVLREVDSKDLAMALKTASEEVSARIYKNMSKRAAEMLREDIEYMGPVRLRDIEETQQKIVAIIRRLEDMGEIIIARGGEDEVIV